MQGGSQDWILGEKRCISLKTNEIWIMSSINTLIISLLVINVAVPILYIWQMHHCYRDVNNIGNWERGKPAPLY